MSLICNETIYNLSNICNCSNTTIDPLSLVDGVYYTPDLVFDFLKIGNNTANDYIMDWMELVWSGYFALFFGTLGTQLKRCKNLVFQLRIFGFYGIWTRIRYNPGFVDAVIFEDLLRCVLSSGLGAVIAIMIKAEVLVEYYTIITVGAGHLINMVDPYFRSKADCESIGPPTEEFPYGVWVDCANWNFAYLVTWINSLFVYIMLGFFLLLLKYGKKKCPCAGQLKRMSSFIAVSMIATNSACTFITSLRRREKIHDENFDTFVQWSYYILLCSFFLAQELIHRLGKCQEKRRKTEASMSIIAISTIVRSKSWSLKSYCCNAVNIVSKFFWGLAMPLYLPDEALKRIIRRIIKVNKKGLDKEDKKNAPSAREIEVEEYWTQAKVMEREKSKSTGVEMVAGAPSSDTKAGAPSSDTKAKPESIKLSKTAQVVMDAKKELQVKAEEDSEDDFGTDV